MLTARYPYLFDAAQARSEAQARDLRGRDRVAASGTFGGSGASIRERVQALGRAGLYAGLATGPVRTLAVIRASLAWADPWDDVAFVIQELGAVPLARAGGFEEILASARA